MVFGESPLKDVYRKLVWGPWRELLEAAPNGWEYRANWALGRAAGELAVGKRAEVTKNLARAFPGRPGRASTGRAIGPAGGRTARSRSWGVSTGR